MLLDKFHNRYIVKGTIVAETPIHIGAGNESIDPVETENAVIKDKDGKPYIPGSSLKGALRSWLEIFLRGSGSKLVGEKNPALSWTSPVLIRLIKRLRSGLRK
ncbi:RAMP superfamily CRISPR-associated protein [Thermoclostridium stercorarium]|uniref:RAMP superfamily CRISPR-associated protein n=1 Tax=Thermoclostridium stercorarium TaxID=1510 RepID=UPI0022488DAD|nr:RAMP superfamily CRISPR-associated protein [Thermoclostridium stercorarium]UZQ85934.1 RAMP superfamily CRISPR-associated protein [Thermoclostridium stercorarium]